MTMAMTQNIWANQQSAFSPPSDSNNLKLLFIWPTNRFHTQRSVRILVRGDLRTKENFDREKLGDKNIGRDQGKLPRATQLGLTEDTFHGDPHDQYHKILYDGNSSDGNISHDIVLRKMFSEGPRVAVLTQLIFNIICCAENVSIWGNRHGNRRWLPSDWQWISWIFLLLLKNEISTCLRPGAGKFCWCPMRPVLILSNFRLFD